MISLPPTVKIFLAVEPADMRKGFDGLNALVEPQLGCDPLSGHLFVFRSRRGDRLKFLYWDRDGLAVWAKRLEQGRYSWPQVSENQRQVELLPAELAMLLEGIDPSNIKRQPRYSRRG